MIKLMICFLILFLSTKIFGQKEAINIDTMKVYSIVDSMPTMPDGQNIGMGFLNRFRNEFKYPDSLTCFIDKIRFEFIISYDGGLVDKKVEIRNINSDCENEKNILKKIGLDFLDRFPKCKSGIHNGKFVNVKFIIPIIIELKE